MSYTIRQAKTADVPRIRKIYNYYVQNTTISFMVHEPNEEYIKSRLHSTLDRELPYLVAVSPSPSDSPKEKVLGYAHVSPFAADKSGYRTAVELTLYLDPGSISSGIGTALMTELLSQLESTPYISYEAGQDDKLDIREPVRVKQVYAIMSVDVAGRGGWVSRGERNREWYERKFGFKEVGRMPGIGEKFGESIDVIYMLKNL